MKLRVLKECSYDTNITCFCMYTEARDGEERRRGGSCSEREAANLAVPIHTQYPGQASLSDTKKNGELSLHRGWGRNNSKQLEGLLAFRLPILHSVIYLIPFYVSL